MPTHHQPLTGFAAVILIMAVAGCASQGDTAPQSKLATADDLNVGATLATASSQASDARIDATWWTSFGDSQLDQIVSKALANSPSLRIAQARVRQAQAAAGIAHSATLPQVQGDAELIRNHFTENEFIPPPYAGNNYWDNKILLEASYGLDLWGKEHKLHDAAISSLRAASAERQAAALALQTAVVRSYLQLALNHALQDIAQATLDQQRQILDIAKKRYKAGLGTQLLISEAETPLPTTEASIEQLKDGATQLRIQLAALSGGGPGDADRIARPQLTLSRILPLPDTIPAHWLANRPDLSAQRWRVQAASSHIDAAKAQFYPDIDLKAFAGFQSLGFSNLLHDSSFLTGFGPAITLPIFNGGKLRSQLESTTAAYDIAVETYNETLINALAQAAGRITAVRSLDQQIESTQQALASAQKAYGLAMTGYRAGLTEYLDVLNTQSRLLDEQRRLAQLEAQRLDAHATLIEALGGGVTPEPPP